MSVEKLIGTRRNIAVDPIGNLSNKLRQITASKNMNDSNIGTLSVSTESFNDTQVTTLTNVYNNFESSIRGICNETGVSAEAYQIEAATMAGMMATNPMASMTTGFRSPIPGSVTVNSFSSDSTPERGYSLEAYDERDNRNAQKHSILYNLLSPRQDAFNETLFPTIIVPPNEIGAYVAIKLFYVYNDFKRSANGTLAEYGRKNLIRGYVDTSIVKNELTKVVPIIRTAGADINTDKFVDIADITPWTEDLGVGIKVTTSFIKVDNKIDLIGISQTNELLSSGIMDASDSLDTYIKLDKLLVRSSDGTNSDFFVIDTSDLPSSVFTFSPIGNNRRMMLSMDTDGIVLSNKNKDFRTGAPLSVMTELATNKVRVNLSIAGSAILDKGDTSVNRGQLSLVTMRDAAGNLVTGAAFSALATKISECEIIGYIPTAYRANLNLRQRGQLVDTQTEYRIIPVRYRSPVSTLAPTSQDNTEDTAAIQTLVTHTGIRIANEAANMLIRTEAALDGYTYVPDAAGSLPEMSAIGHYAVIPTFYRDEIDFTKVVDSRVSHERLKDVRAALIEKVRYFANEMYRNSEMKSVASVLTGNPNFKPTVIVATDVVTHNYLIADGDIRTLGDSFDMVIVSSVADCMKDKMYITFGVFDESRNTAINPLNFGNMLYSPEVVVNLPIPRNGAVNKELTVTPRFSHIVNLPVLTALTIRNLPAMTSKIATNFHSV